MQRRLASVLLVGVLILLVTGFGSSCTHRGSLLEGPVAEAWVARFSSSSDGGSARAIVVDPSGNIHVTGGSYAHWTTGADYLTVKYDGSGKVVWSAKYDGPASTSDEAKAIAVDASGNVYVTGYSMVEGDVGEGPYDCDYATIKYGPDGTQLWVATYNGPGSFSDKANAIAVDGSGNVYVTGTSSRDGYVCYAAHEYATIKYDTNGNQLWVAKYRGPVNGHDCANDIAVDAEGHVYVTGYSAGRECVPFWAGQACVIADYATIKYDTDGNQLWVARYSAPDGGSSSALAMALDGPGNVYVTGESRGLEEGANQDCITVKYDSAGKELWVARLDGPASGQDSAADIAVDAHGNVYLAGYVSCNSGGAWHRDYLAAKYDTNGNELWMEHYGSAPGDDRNTGGDEAYAIAVDSSGNAYVTGESYYDGENEDVDNDSVTVKYDANGTQLWVARYNGSGSGRDTTTAIALDGNGDVYVAGSADSGNQVRCLTIKYVPE